KLDAARIRVHGDLTLDRLRWTGHAFALVELSGPLDRLASDQRILRSPLVDVAALLVELELVARETQASLAGRGLGRGDDLTRARRFWVRAVRDGLVGAWRDAVARRDEGAPALVPEDDAAFATLSRAYELKRLLAELDRAVAADRPGEERVEALLEAIGERLP
ncbi:MAG: hypothetical protein KC635_09850, partial [Myxococcales bacterium]|nr:hypothetical protein [Myxococcales bacterium]